MLRRVVAFSLLVLTLAACAPDTGTGDQAHETMTESESASPSASGEESGGVVEEPVQSSEPEPEPVDPMTGPQTCGTVTSTSGETLTVEIVAGDSDCAFAEDLLDTYYNDPPAIPEGSGAYLAIENWECNSSSSQDPGRSSTCRHPDGGEIVTFPGGGGEGGSDTESGGYCEQIDQPTLEQLFDDGEFDEQVCESYIGGENAVSQQD
ncbi:hypothetical protein [Ruania halotolerans]|uniref:hypothetical protein n=1 Tax=Ruania halotolerans TaxID=2897773 RepID=UPI001E4AC898|nr:hypothetical protein [Ruania halotolerans]UFU05167.1 hypothetical protein LQF10_11875 [Ruania halotolerans]